MDRPPVCLFERARTPRHFLLGKGHPPPCYQGNDQGHGGTRLHCLCGWSIVIMPDFRKKKKGMHFQEATTVKNVRHTFVVIIALACNASFLKGHQDVFSLVKGTLRGNCKCLPEHFKGTRALTRGPWRHPPSLPPWSIRPDLKNEEQVMYFQSKSNHC